MSRVYDRQASERAVAVAAVAFSINSLEEDAMEHQRKRKIRAKERSRKEATSSMQPQLVAAAGRVSIKQNQNAGGTRTPTRTPTPKPTRQDYRVEQTVFPSNRPGDHHLSSPKETGLIQNQKQNGTKPDSWEKAQMAKINKRYEKLKSSILAWENEKKVRARIKMERRKITLEQRRTRNQQHFDAKISRIDNISRGARDQLEEKRRKEESGIKEKARKMRMPGQKSVKYCFCFGM